MDELFDPHTFSGVIPIFPLPNVVLFPRMLLPLHIFEPRYRKMVADAIDGEHLIGMGLLKEGWEKDYYGSPPIHNRLGMGKIVRCERMEDGRYNLLLLGIQRAEIVEMDEFVPYRRARIRLLEEEKGELSEEAMGTMKQVLLSEYRRMHKLMGNEPLSEKMLGNTSLPLGALTDAIAAVLELSMDEKQTLLEEVNVIKRANHMNQWIANKIRSIAFFPKLFEFDAEDPRLN